jgi:hypothetical protein
MRRLAVLSLLLLLAAPACAESDFWTARQVSLGPDQAAGAVAGTLRFKGALVLTSADRRFGGLSGLHIDQNLHVTAISDRGYFVEFDLLEDAAETLVATSAPVIVPMTDAAGAPLRGADRDAEDIAILPDGQRLVVFERNARLGWFAPGSARQARVASLLDLVPGSNEDIESVVPLPDGRLLLIAERLGSWAKKRFAWIGEPGLWEALEYVPVANDDVSSATLLPSGDLLVLERTAGVLTGFEARLRRVPAASIRPGGLLDGETLVELRPPGLADNFEGIATRPLPDGRAAIYLVSDDNYFPLERTYLVKFETLAP